MKRIVLFILVVFSLISCKKETVFLRSYVTRYIGVDEIMLKESDLNSGYINILYKGYNLGNYYDTGKLKESYDALCEKHNDMTYNREVTLIVGDEYYTPCIGADFTSIDVVSNSDYDEVHLAESSLGDIVLFMSQSLKPFIDSNYTSQCEYNIYCASPVENLLTELTPDQLTMLGEFGYSAIGSLKFTTQPTLSKTHKFTVTMTADDGRVFTASIDMTFE